MCNRKKPVEYDKVALACWVAAGICATVGTAIASGIGAGLGIAALWFVITSLGRGFMSR